MAANKVIVLGPTALPTAIANLFSPPTGISGGAGVPATITNAYYLLRKMRVTNNSAVAVAFALWKQITIGASPVAGKEFAWGGLATLLVLNVGTGQIVQPQGQVEWAGAVRLAGDEADKFLVGGMTSTATAGSLTIEVECEIGFI